MRIVASHQYRIRTLTLRDNALILVRSGRKQLIAADRTLPCQPGQAVLIASGTQWDVINDPAGSHQYEALAVAFPGEMVHAFEASVPPPLPRAVESAQVLEVDAQLNEAVLRLAPPPGAHALSPALFKHRAEEILLLLAERGFHFRGASEQSWEERVRRLIAQRPHADWKLENIAQVFHISVSSLRRRLQDSPFSLAELVREVRLEVALALLQSSDVAVGEVAQRCGWASHSRFTAMFQQRWGVAPSVVKGRLTATGQKLSENG